MSMVSSTLLLLLLGVAASVVLIAEVEGCGMPPAPPPPAPMCCPAPPPPAPCCGRRKRQSNNNFLPYYTASSCNYGCSSGRSGRMKRQAVQPVFKTEDTPCPQNGWKQLMEDKLTTEDAATSVNDIQLALFNRFPDDKFLVMCALAGDENVQKAQAQGPILPNKVSLSSRGDGYCNVVKGRIWCQAVSLSA